VGKRTWNCEPRSAHPRRVLLLGATGTIGRATLRALVRRGHHVTCFVRPFGQNRAVPGPDDMRGLSAASTIRFGEVTNPISLASEGFGAERFDVLVSCLASRNGAPADAWAIDYQANANALAAAQEAGVSHFVLLSAICVQKPVLAFQHAKLAFEKLLIESGLAYTIIRPTAFFKSLSGQVERVKRGKPFLVFGDGRLTSCKPISDDDLGEYIADCLEDESRKSRVLPIGGPGDAITPRQQGECLFALLKRPPQFRQIPVALLDGIIGVLGALGHVAATLSDKAELARIGRYYATESMLVLDPASGRYDSQRTPSTGTETLFDFYARLVKGALPPERGDHAVF
jgi:divinyl chlorophyllide a 8-vinyl-reductase